MNGLALSLLLTLNVLFNPESGSYFSAADFYTSSSADTVSVARMAESIFIDSLNYDPDAFIPVEITDAAGADLNITGLKVLKNFVLPYKGKVISHYGIRRGRMHTGTDIKLQRGDTVIAAYKGVVARASSYYGYGKLVVIDHSNGLETYYSHLSSMLVKPGDTVSTAQPVGLGGRTGRATTDHLHFEIRENRKPYNTELVFDYERGITKPEVSEWRSFASISSLVNPKKGNSSQSLVNQASVSEYAIKAGDNLWQIARRFGTSVSTLCHLNQLTPSTVLKIGRVIKITDPAKENPKNN